MTDKTEDWILEQVEQIMIHDGPDRHTDGSDVITNFIISLLNKEEDQWVSTYQAYCEKRQKENQEWFTKNK